MAHATHPSAPEGATGVLVLADGTIVWGRGFGAEGEAVGEVVFNTAMTGYQEVMTDPSYAAQIITFTFPHIGNVGANYEDLEADNPFALGCIVAQDVTAPSNYRAVTGFAEWMRSNGRIGISGVDTRALTRRIREGGRPNGVIAHDAAGAFDLDALLLKAREWPGLEGMDLAAEVSCRQMFRWSGGRWKHGVGYGEGGVSEQRFSTSLETNGMGDGQKGPLVSSEVEKREVGNREVEKRRPHVVAIDYGSKRNIFRNLADAGADVTVLPATATFEDVMAHKPDGIFLSNGPGDPAATGTYAGAGDPAAAGDGQAPVRHLPRAPIARARGGRQDGEDAPGPPRRQPSGQAPGGRPRRDHQHEPRLRGGSGEPAGNARATHVSLFDGSLAGLELTDRRAFSVQYHPEASPGPQDSTYLFKKFVELLR
jgi:carbamoyl-phosphate synthase small subunit